MPVFYPSIPASDGAYMSPAVNAVFEVFELSDAQFTSPLALITSSGGNGAPLITTELGVTPPIYVDSPNLSHNFKSGSWVWRRDSFDGAAEAVETAKTAAVAAARAAEAPTDAKVDEGIQRANLPKLAADAVAESPTVSAAAAAAVGNEIEARDLVEGSDLGILRPSSNSVKVPTYHGPSTELDTVSLTKRVVTEGTTQGTRWLPRLLVGEALTRPLSTLHGYLRGTVLGNKWAEDALQGDGTVPDWILQRWKQRGQFGVPDATMQPVDIVIVAGQSNATKRGSVVSDQEPELPALVMWNSDDQPGTAWAPHSGAPWLGSGFGRAWLRDVAGWQNRRVGLVRAALGSSGFSSKTPGTWDRVVTAGADRYLYPEMIARAKAALAGSPVGSKIVGVVWSQGEQDRNMTQSAYEAKLDDLIKQTRIDLGIPDLPFMLTSMTPELIAAAPVGGTPAPSAVTISAVIEDTTRRLTRTSFHQGPPNMSEGDTGIHWTPQGQSLRGGQIAGDPFQQAKENLPTSMPQSPHSFKIVRSGNSALITWEHPFSRVTSYTIETSTDEGLTWAALNLGARITHRAALAVPAALPLWVRGTANNEKGASMASVTEKG